MRITFLGATHQVTGSCSLLEWLPGRYLLVDYGMEQGVNPYKTAELPVLPSQIEYIFLTHAHIDHSGNLPLLYRNGFRGTIYATPETINLCAIMLADSAHIQETDASYQTKKNLRAGREAVDPVYTLEDAQGVMRLFRSCLYNEEIFVDEGISVRFLDAGHLLGSSFVIVSLEENGEQRRIVFSGDVGNLNQPIIRDPQRVPAADYLLIESTYGTRLHESTHEPIPYLVETLRETFSRGGSVIIPAFAVGRTQELLYFFREIKQRNLLPEFASFPVYVDSPLANEATAVFLQCDVNCLDEEAQAIMRSGNNPIWFDGLHTVVDTEESKALNENTEQKVIIASGGMCEGGRIRHHLKHTLWEKKNTILFVGYQAEGTLGRMIYDGMNPVKIMGEEIEVNAEIRLLIGISGHADRNGLLNWFNNFEQRPKTVFVNHGDDESCTGFAELLRQSFGIAAYAPYSGAEYDLLNGEWIRLTDPELRPEFKAREEHAAPTRKKENAFSNLLKAVEKLSAYTTGLEGHANSEIRELTAEILNLIPKQ